MTLPRFQLVEVPTDPIRFVFDINVWLSAADLLTPYPTRDDRERLDAASARRPVPDHEQPDVDAYRTWRMGASGIFVPPLPAEVFISRYMERTLATKLTQSPTAPIPEDRGLGWDPDEATDFIEDAVRSFALRPEQVGCSEPVGSERHMSNGEELDHEDGMVLACAISVGAHYLITRDSDFNAVRTDPRWSRHLNVVTPGTLSARRRRYGAHV